MYMKEVLIQCFQRISTQSEETWPGWTRWKGFQNNHTIGYFVT